MMKRLCLAVIIACVMAATAQAQQIAIQKNLTARTTTGTSNAIDLTETGVQFHRLIWYARGVVSTCQVKLEQSSTGSSGWTDLIGSTTCTSTGRVTADVSGTVNYVRINLGTISGGGSVGVVYQGFQAIPAYYNDGVPVLSTDVPLITPTGYTVSVGAGSSNNLALTNSAVVTVSAGTRIVLHRAEFSCGSDVSVAVTVSLGFAAATLPTTGAGLIWASRKTEASHFQGFHSGSGWPGVLAVGASGEDLRLTMTVPTGGACDLDITYSTEAV